MLTYLILIVTPYLMDLTIYIEKQSLWTSQYGAREKVLIRLAR